MRPIRLELHNFGPFLHEDLDFTQLSRELFLITGPTGSGKSTIFDAICYALYGTLATEGRSSQDMLSHFANPQELTKIVFTFSLAGETYRLERIPEQERKKLRGEGTAKQKSEAHLYYWQGGEERLMATGTKEVDQRVQEILALDVTQFRQIVMLPQGEFSKLLKSSAADREKLLKSVFRMERYGLFAKGLEQRRRAAAAQKLELATQLRAELEHIDAADNDALALAIQDQDKTTAFILDALDQSLTADEKKQDETQATLSGLANERIRLDNELSAAKSLNEKFNQLAEKSQTLETLAHDTPAFKEKEKTLKLMRRAGQVRPYYDSYEEAIQRAATSRKARELAEQRLIQLTAEGETLKQTQAEVLAPSYTERQMTLLDEARALTELVASLKETAALAKQKKDLDTEIATLEVHVAQQQELTEQLVAAEKACGDLEKEILGGQAELSRRESTLNTERRRLERLDDFLARMDEIEKRQAQLAELRHAWQKADQVYQQSKTAREELAQQLTAEQAAALATHLVSGEPCPVCGCPHHPQPATYRHAGSDGDKLTRLETAEAEAKTKRDALVNKGQFQKTEIETAKGTLIQLLRESLDIAIPGDDPLIHKNTLTEKQATLTEVITKGEHDLERRSLALSQQRGELTTRCDNLKQLQASLTKTESQSDLETIRSKAATLEGKLDSARQRNESLAAPYGDLPTGDVSALTNRAKSAADQAQGMADHKEVTIQAFQNHKEALASAAAEFKAAVAADDQAVELAAAKSSAFTQSRTEHDLSLETFKEYYHYTAVDADALEKEIRAFEQQRHALESEIAGLKGTLEDKRPVDLAALEEQQLALNEKIKGLEQALTLIHEKQKKNRRQHELITALDAELTQVETNLDRLRKLENLVSGNVAGRQKISLERYILSVYLEEILASANLFLDKMSGGRYRLALAERSGLKAKGLDIDVSDAYTGRQRSAATLSGGETFMAALAMALGLSDTIQAGAGGISLETIFVDEGFATLDPGALDDAINCLLSIREDGRAVGIISHVEELKERIDTKITVTKTEVGSHLRVIA